MRQSPSRRDRPTPLVTAVLVAAATSLAAACTSGPTPGAHSTTAMPQPSTTQLLTSPSSSSTTSTPSAPASSARSTPTAATPAAPSSCAPAIVSRMSPSERAGQLLMVGLGSDTSRTSLDALVTGRHLGGVILLGGWTGGSDSVRTTTRHLAGLASKAGTAGLGLLLAADQEGGAVQQLRGPGFSRMPSARVQDQDSPSNLTAEATRWGAELRRAGINVNLAPVADTVPTSVGRANGPIGQYDRQYSSDPERVSTMVGAFLAGMRAGGVAATVKHFPGIGRITGNTDVTARGITDGTTTVDDPYLEPFRTGIQDGVELVMVGSAIYSRIDPGTNAVFSGRIVTDLLRDRLSYDGVVITDDVGAARSVAGVPVGERATRFIEAGGDITLTARPGTVPAMHDAITTKATSNPAFAKQVEAAATRVVDLKLRMGLAHCP